jgi:glutamine amidotransferase
MIVIVDYGASNLGSIINMFNRIGVTTRVASKANELGGATAIILPGLGHFDSCAKKLKDRGFASALEEPAFSSRIPILGICVGAQLLTKGSEEGNEMGLGWIDAVSLRFPIRADPKYKIPHMGWNIVEPAIPHRLFTGMEQDPRFYFVHSYYIKTTQPNSILCRTTHGIEFASGIRRDNIYGVQFHPEKSHRFGLRLFENFSNMQNPA